MKRNKSCNDINLNDNSNDYEIKNPRSINKDKKSKKVKVKEYLRHVDIVIISKL